MRIRSYKKLTGFIGLGVARGPGNQWYIDIGPWVIVINDVSTEDTEGEP